MARKMRVRAGIFFALLFLLIATPVFAEVTSEGYYRSPLRYAQDNYLALWGNEQFPRNQDYGITINVLEESVSATWVDIEVQVQYPIIQDRHISKFYILGNGKIIDQFFPKLYDSDDDGIYDGYWSYYQVKPTFVEAIGSVVSFRVIGIQTVGDLYDETSGEYIVAWSKESDPIWFDPLPVTDKQTHSLLENILYVLQSLLNKLQELLNTLKQKMDSLQEAVEKIYTPTQQTMNEFNQAVDKLMDKMPFNELKESAQNIVDTYENTRRQLSSPGSKIGFGGQFCFIPGVPETCVENILDLTEFRQEVLLLREIMRAMIWLYFFHMLFMWLRPKMRF